MIDHDTLHLGSPEIEHDWTKEIVCPWCGYVYDDSSEIGPNAAGDLGALNCEECGKHFYASREVEITYLTKCATYGTCAACGSEDVCIESMVSSNGNYKDLCSPCSTEAERRLKAETLARLAGQGYIALNKL